MQSFEYANPTTVQEAVGMLGTKWGQTDVLAGGTDLISLMKDHLHEPKRVVNIKNIKELEGVSKTADGLRIGALVTFCYLAWLSHRLARAGLRKVGIAVGVVLVAQVLLGIGNVHLGLPLPVATAHNGVAALLLFTLLAALASTQRLPAMESP